jgi:hypothetical protein
MLLPESSFLKNLPPCNTSNSNKRNESEVMVCFPYCNLLVGVDSGKMFTLGRPIPSKAYGTLQIQESLVKG